MSGAGQKEEGDYRKLKSFDGTDRGSYIRWRRRAELHRPTGASNNVQQGALGAETF